jgi:hypothetical protein
MNELMAHELDQSAVTLAISLRLVEATVVNLERAPMILGSPESPWLGELTHGEDTRLRSYLCDLELRAGGHGPTLFRKAAVVSLGAPRHKGLELVVPIEWRAATLSSLFPVLVGQLRVAADRLELEGRYAPPGGRLGYLLDVGLLGVAARQTGRWFLRKVAAALT